MHNISLEKMPRGKRATMQGNKQTLHGWMDCRIGVRSTEIYENIKLNLYVHILRTRKNYSFDRDDQQFKVAVYCYKDENHKN